jgi:two-component system, NtrC family, nitrogen regulation response regulator GlnG
MSSLPLQVWLVDDDESIRWVLERALKHAGMVPTAFESAEAALAELRRRAPQVLMTDVRMSGKSGIELLNAVSVSHPGLPVIVMTAHADLSSAVSAYGSGAFEYLPKPFDIDEAVALVQRAGESARKAGTMDDDATESAGEPEPIMGLLGRAPAMQTVFRAIGRLSRSSVNVLVTGESGTGKELVARALHEHSPRERKPFIALNTSAIPSELLESELFGHEKGAFTGADAQRRGRFEQADGGTLFLDEIGDMNTSLQTRLLRVLAEKEFYRVGGQSPIKVDVRVIAATHQNLDERVKSGQFREDLFHRLNVIRIELPPLQARSEDVPALLNHYLKVAAQELGVEAKVVTPPALQQLQRYRWPGNVRELVNVCRRVTALSAGSELRLEDLPPEISGAASDYGPGDWTAALAQWANVQGPQPAKPWLEVAMPAFETTLIQAALKATHGHKQEAAKLLGWGRNTLTRKLQELGLSGGEAAAG